MINYYLLESDKSETSTNHSIGFVVSVILFGFIMVVINPLDLVTTALYLDATTTRSVWAEPFLLFTGDYATKESMALVLMLYGGTMLMPFISHQMSWFVEQERVKGNTLVQKAYNFFLILNWKKAGIHALWSLAIIFDCYADSMYRGGGRLVVADFVVALVFFGFMSEFLGGYTLKVIVDSFRLYYTNVLKVKYEEAKKNAGKKKSGSRTPTVNKSRKSKGGQQKQTRAKTTHQPSRHRPTPANNHHRRSENVPMGGEPLMGSLAGAVPEPYIPTSRSHNAIGD